MNPTEYEKFTGKFISFLCKQDIKGVEILHSRDFVGKTGQSYNIDLSYKFKVGGFEYLTLVECKSWNQAVGRNIIVEFKGTLDDIGAHKGIVVTTSGFESGAIGFAKSTGIGLMKLGKTGSFEHLLNFDGPIQIVSEYISNYSTSNIDSELEGNGLIYPKRRALEYIKDVYGTVAYEFLINPNSEQYLDSGRKPSKEIVDAILKIDWFWMDQYYLLELSGLPFTSGYQNEDRILNMLIATLKTEFSGELPSFPDII